MLDNTKELAQRLRVVPTTVYRMMADGRIPPELFTKIGGQWRFNGEGIERHLLEMPIEPPTNP